jgi:hypothetical protein
MVFDYGSDIDGGCAALNPTADKWRGCHNAGQGRDDQTCPDADASPEKSHTEENRADFHTRQHEAESEREV